MINNFNKLHLKIITQKILQIITNPNNPLNPLHNIIPILLPIHKIHNIFLIRQFNLIFKIIQKTIISLQLNIRIFLLHHPRSISLLLLLLQYVRDHHRSSTRNTSQTHHNNTKDLYHLKNNK